MNVESMKLLENLRSKIVDDISVIIEKKEKHISTMKKALDVFKDYSNDDTINHAERAIAWDLNSQRFIKESILDKLKSYKLKEKTVIDVILSGYYINYYGTALDITSSRYPFIDNILETVLISKDSSYITKLEKLTQVIYQENYGLSFIDEFMNTPAGEDFVKIEEISMFSGKTSWIEVSGIKCKFDKIEIPNHLVEAKTTLLANNSTCSLNSTNFAIETDNKRGDRISLACPPFTRNYGFNIRRHYPKVVDKATRIRIGSSSNLCEDMLDKAMKFYARVLILGAQGAGKTTFLRDLTARYPVNSVVVTIETSFELNLEKYNENLIVREVCTSDISYKDCMKYLFRYGLDGIVLSEIRNGVEAYFFTQFSEKQKLGAISTLHGTSPIGSIYAGRDLLLESGTCRNENIALDTFCRATDLIAVLDVNQVTGLRFIEGIYATPSTNINGFVKEVDENGKVVVDEGECVPIFKYTQLPNTADLPENEKEYYLSPVCGFPPHLIRRFATRRLGMEKELEKLARGDYSND